MRVAPGAQAAPQQGQAPQPSPQGGAPSGGAGSSPAEQAIQMIQQGYTILGKLMQSAGQNLPPDDMKLFQAAAQATDALLQSLTGPAQGQGGPQQPQQSGPMAANDNGRSQPAGPQG